MGTNSNDVDRYIDNMINNFLNKQHKETAKEFIETRRRYEKNKKNRKLTNYTLRNDVQTLLALDRFLKKPYIDATQDDLINFEEHLRKEHIPAGKSKINTKRKGLNESTIEQYMIHIKRFYKWIHNKEQYKKGYAVRRNLPYPDCVSWIQSTGKSKDIFKEDLPSEDEILKLLEVMNNHRDQAMFGAGFYDAGLRNGELITLNLDSVQKDKLGYKFILPKEDEYETGDQKTGRGVIRLFIMSSSTHYLRDFLNHHPFYKFKDSFKVPLFYTMDARTYLKVLSKAQSGTVTQDDFEKLRLSRPGIEQILTKYCKMAGIKHYKPHDLRHLSATRCWELGFNEPELRVRYRWSTKSKMPSRYIHTTATAIDEKIKVINGFEEPQEVERSKLVPIVCWNCNEENVPTNKFCGKCGYDLKLKPEERTVTAIDTGLTIEKIYQEIQKLKEEIKKK